MGTLRTDCITKMQRLQNFAHFVSIPMFATVYSRNTTIPSPSPRRHVVRLLNSPSLIGGCEISSRTDIACRWGLCMETVMESQRCGGQLVAVFQFITGVSATRETARSRLHVICLPSIYPVRTFTTHLNWHTFWFMHIRLLQLTIKIIFIIHYIDISI